MRYAIISPHHDDAVWSLGEHIVSWMEDGHEIEIITVFAMIPEDGPFHAKMSLLQREHMLVMGALDLLNPGRIMFTNMHFPDAAVRIDQGIAPLPPITDRWIAELRATIRMAEPNVVIWPRGIHHPDHQWVNHFRHQLGKPDDNVEWWIYEELPYRTMYPEDVTPIVDMELAGDRPNLWHKKRVSRLYASQLNPPDEMERHIWSKERLWVPMP